MNDSRALDRVAVMACVAVACVAVAPAALSPLWDADVWWILRAGRDLVVDGHVPHRNRYGFTAPDAAWVMHEWGFGVAYALLSRCGLAWLALPRVAAVVVTAWAATWRSMRDARPLVAAACVAVALAVFGGRFESPRPVGITYALVCALAAVCFEGNFSARHAALTTAMMLAWANAHGSFPLGFLVLALGLATPGGDRRARIASLVCGLAVTAVNPYGLALHGLALRYALGLGGDSVSVVHARILEWWPLWRDPWRVATGPQLVAALAMSVVALASLKDPRWRARGALTLALLMMALRHNRHLGLAGITCAPLLAGPVESMIARGAWRTRYVSRAALLACVVAPAALGVALWGVAARSRAEGDWVDASRQDEAARALIEAMPEGARAFVELPFTGFAVLVGAPRVSMFFDARNDCYPADVLREALDVNDGRLAPSEALRVLRARGTTHALVRCASRAARSLSGAERVASRDGVCLYRVGPSVGSQAEVAPHDRVFRGVKTSALGATRWGP